MRRQLLALVVVVLSGCSILQDFGQFSTEPSGAADADPSDAADGGADARGDVDIDAAGFCTTTGQHAFCADFDSVGTVAEGWTQLRLQGDGGTVAFDDVLFRSAPRGARMRVLPGGSACAFAQLSRVVPGAFTSARVELDLRLSAGTPATNVAAITIAQQCVLVVAPGPGQLAYRQDDTSGTMGGTSTPLSRQIVPDTFEHLVIEFAVGGQSPAIRVTLGGEVVGVTATVPSICMKSGPVNVHIGPHCASTSSSERDVRVDNVTIDVQ